jgi:hypothetical protein
MKRLLFIFLFACISLYSESFLFTEQSTPTPALRQLLDIFDLSDQNDLQSIVEATQKHWLQTGKERWEFAKRDEDKRDLLVPIFKDLKMIDTIDACSANYDYALIYGATYSSVIKRMRHLVSQFKRGVRFKQVILLTGQRYLKFNEKEKHLPYQTETEMMLSLWKTMAMPEEIRSLPFLLVDTPQQNRNGNWVRPNTEDTLIKWLKTNPTPGSCLFVSNQPYTGYQDAVARCALPDAFSIETIGVETGGDLPIALLLDNIARWIYTENKIRRSQVGISE